MADQGCEGMLSPFLRRRRFAAVVRRLHGRVLDVGCGSGGLADYVSSANYYGHDVDAEIVLSARNKYPRHLFSTSLPGGSEAFDTIVVLAVLEHAHDPVHLLKDLKARLSNDAGAQILITTPHPSVDWVHSLGARYGIFSQHANDEHEELFDKEAIERCARKADLRLTEYRRFLWGANQLAVLVPW